MRCLALLCLVVVTAASAACGPDIDVQTRTFDPGHALGDMDVYAPASAGDTVLPGVILIHGGGWWTGTRGEMSAYAERLAGNGYVVAAIDYRLVPEGAFPAAVQDSFCALSYLRLHSVDLGLDPTRIVAVGYSAGAHLAAMLAVAADVDIMQDPDCPSGQTGPVRGVVAGSGPMDLTILDDDTTRDFVGVPLQDDPERWRQASPLTHVGPSEPPALFVHAEHDLVVDVGQSELMQRALQASGNQAAMLRLEGGGHALSDGSGLGQEQYELAIETPEAWMAIVDFLDRTTAPPTETP